MVTTKSVIPYSIDVSLSEYQKHKGEKLEGWGAEHNWDYLLIHHTEPHEFVHYSATRLFESGIRLDCMNINNSFGPVVHCFSTECPDQTWSQDISKLIPHYFVACDWWECVDTIESPLCIRYCLVNRDIDPDELYAEPMLSPVTPMRYCVEHFGQEAADLEAKYPNASKQGNLVGLVLSIFNEEDTVV